MSSRSADPTFKSRKENMKVIKFLGGGSFGNVFKTSQQLKEDEHELQTKEFAVKQISVEMYKFHFKNEVTPFSKILREVHLLQKMGNVSNNQDSSSQSFVVKLYGYWIEGEDAEDEEALDKPFFVVNPDFSSSQPPPPLRNWLFMQMELCDINLFDWLKTNKRIEAKDKTSKLVQTLNIMEQLLQALTFIHNFPPNGVVHRDIKPDNIFLTFQERKIFVKLGDFGLGRVLRENKSHVTTVTLGSARYKSPEMLKEDGYYDTKTDVFSMGLVILEVIVYYEGKIYGEENPEKIKTILDKLFYRIQVGKLDNLGDEIKSEELNLEIEIVNRMTKFEKEKRWNAATSLQYFQNPDKFITLLEKERKEMRLIFYNIPPLTTPFFFGREDNLKELSNFFLNPDTSVIWLSGPIAIGVTELASNFVRKLKGDIHCIWLEYQTLTSSLKSLCEFLGILIDLENADVVSILNLVATDLCRRDSSVPILLIFHDILFTFEASKLVKDLLKSDLLKAIGNLLKVILITQSNPPGYFTSMTVGPLDLHSSALMIKEGLPYLTLDFDYYLSTFEQVARLAFCTPGLIKRLTEYMNDLQSTPNPMNLFDAITFLMYDMTGLIKFQRNNSKASFLSIWQKLRKEHLDFEEWEYQILQVLCLAFPERADANDLFEICNKNLQIVVDFEQFEQFKNNISFFNIGTFRGQWVEVNPLVSKIVKAEFTLEESFQNSSSILTKLLELANEPKAMENTVTLQIFQNLWNWLAVENELRQKYLREFVEFTVNLGGNWKLPPLNEGCNRFACQAWVQHKFIQLQKDFNSLGEQNSELAIFTIKCYEVVYNVVNDLWNEGNNYLKSFIELRIFLIKNEKKVSSNFNFKLSQFLLEMCCPKISSFLLEKNDQVSQTEKDLIKSWILSELKVNEGFREVDFVVFSFLLLLRREEYKTILEFGELIIAHLRDEQFDKLIFVIVFLCVVMHEDSFLSIPDIKLLIKKFEAIRGLDKTLVFKGDHLWKLLLFDKWPKWFANAIFISNKFQVILNVLLSIIYTSQDTQQEYFEELRAYYDTALENCKKRGRPNSIRLLSERYENILNDIIAQANELFGSGKIPEFYRNYLNCEVNQCWKAAKFKDTSIPRDLTNASVLNDSTHFLIALAMYGNQPELGGTLDELKIDPGLNAIFINENGYFVWDINNDNCDNSEFDSLDLVRDALNKCAEILMPQIIKSFSTIYTSLGGGALVHLLLSPITAQYQKELLENIKSFVNDEAVLKSVVILLSEKLQLNSGIYEINTIFGISVAIVLHLLVLEKYELGSYLLKTLSTQFKNYYKGRGKLVSLGEHFEKSYNRGLLPLPAIELGIFETCISLMHQYWEKDYANKCLNFLRILMKFTLNAKFTTPIVTEENRLEQLEKILVYFKKLGIGDEMNMKKGTTFSVKLASIIFMLCLDNQHFPGKEDSAVQVLEGILKYYLQREEFYKILSFGRGLGFDSYSDKFNLVLGKACANIEFLGAPLSFEKLEEILKIKLFDFKDSELEVVCEEEGEMVL